MRVEKGAIYCMHFEQIPGGPKPFRQDTVADITRNEELAR